MRAHHVLLSPALFLATLLACAPTPERIAAALTEDCEDGRDNDGDGLADCWDSDCTSQCPEDCGDGEDNNGNGLVDCEDAACSDACTEDCEDGVDNDGDDRVDCEDSDCSDVCTEDCEDGVDNDGDGLVDCEDEACLDTCLEDCGDGRDNDGDGLVDCDDDECVGDEACGSVGTHQVEANVYFDQLGWHIYEHTPWRVEMYFYGYISLTGTPLTDTSSFSCTGYLWGYSYGPDYSGVTYDGASSEQSYLFTFQPQLNSSLQWFGPCPIRDLPARTWGTIRQEEGIYDASSDDWTLQYIALDADTFVQQGDVHHHLDDLFPIEPRTWVVDYPSWGDR